MIEWLLLPLLAVFRRLPSRLGACGVFSLESEKSSFLVSSVAETTFMEVLSDSFKVLRLYRL